MFEDQAHYETQRRNKEIHDEYRQGIAIIRYLADRYYKDHVQVVPDHVYDELLLNVQALELQYGLNDPDSPVDKILDKPDEYSWSSEIYPPMISIETKLNIEVGHQKVIDDFIEKIKGKLKTDVFEIVPEWKYDGIAVNLDYFRGQLVRACTRRGEVITDKAFRCDDIPKVLSNSQYAVDVTQSHICVRGELLIHKTDLLRINTYLYDTGEKLYANERSAVSAIARKVKYCEEADFLRFAQYEVAVLRRLKLTETFGDCLKEENAIVEKIAGMQTHRDMMLFLTSVGFKHTPTFTILTTGNVPNSAMANTLLAEVYQQAQKDRASLPFAVDGLVYKLNDLDLRKKAGSTTHHPHWAIAHKFDAVTHTTVLRDIVFQIGRSGVLSPVGIFDPVKIDATTITRAPLYNEKWINLKALEVGQFIEVYRSGDTIPIIMGPRLTVDVRTKPFSVYEYLKGVCPCCGSAIALRHSEDTKISEAAWVCTNEACPDRVAAALVYFAGKFNMDICGLGEAVAKQLVNEFKIKNPLEIYDISFNDLYPKGQLKTKNKKKYPSKLYAYIHASKLNPLWRLLKSIGIPGIGEHAAKELAQRFLTFDRLLDADMVELTRVPGVDLVLAKNIMRYFGGSAERKQWIKRVGDYQFAAVVRFPKPNLSANGDLVAKADIETLNQENKESQ